MSSPSSPQLARRRSHHLPTSPTLYSPGPPVSMPARSPRPAATHAAAAAVSPATQKAYHPNDDIAFWSALYSQHPVHTRQDVALETTSSSLHHTSHQRPIKICQVLTKTVLPQDSADPQHPPPVHFERLPIKVQTSASSLSPNGRPFSIVFFFTVESAPTTLWYLDSSFTQSATLHEHMELMGTFQPNSPADPVPFYMYETHTFNITQPAHEDTMLDIRVQSPDGTIYAEFSYTFVSQVTSAPLSPRIDTSHQRSDSRATTEAHPDTTCARSRPHSLEKLKIPSFSPPDTLVSPSTLSPLDGYDMVEPTTPVSPTNLSHGYYAAQPLTAAAEINNTTIGHHIGTLPNPPTRPAHASSHSGLASGDDDHDDNDKELIADTFVDEPDAGEHFIQATSEFFSKVGYWLYNSRVGQYIARDDRSRTKVVFQTEDIWILGICYSFENTEPTCSLPEATRSRKVSTPSARTGDPRISIANGFTLLPDNFRDSKRKTVLQMPSPAPPVPDIDPAHALDSTFQGSESHSGRSRSQERHLHKQRTKELAKAKKVAQAKELAVEREQRMLRKEQEDREKLKSKISGPLFDRNNLRDGTMHISNLHVDPGHNPEPTRITPHDTDRKSRSLHGYQHDERPHLGLGLAMTSSDEIKKNTLRKARSNSILQGVKSAAASRFRKKSVMDVQGQHQLQGQSVSNLSGLSQKSTGVSSFSSYDGPFPNPPPLPLASKSVISFHEAFGAGSGALAKLSLRNLSQKKLPELPRTVNSSMSDQPSDQTYSHDSDGRQVVSLPLPPPDMTEPPDSPKSLRRRMTMTLFIKEPKTTSMNGMAALKKSLANSSRISLRLKPEDGPTTPVAEGPVISESRSLGKPASSKIANWIGWRRSSNNLHQQALAAAAAAEEEPPVPPLDWSHRTISPPSSPVPSPYADGSTATARTTSMHERQYDKNAPQQRTTTTTTTTRPRKKSTLSAKSMSSTLSSPMSPTAPDLPRPLSPIKALNGAISSPHSFSTNGIHSGDPSKGMDLESGDLPNIESTKSSVQPGDDGDDPSDKSSLDLSQQSDQMTSSDPPNFQNLRADLSLSSSSSSDAVPMVPDLTSEQTTGKTSLFDGDQQPIQNSTRLVHTKTMKDFAQGDRERIRKIASTYIKAKNSSSSSSSSPGAATPKDHQETCLDNEKGSTPDSLDPNKTSNSGHTPPGLPSPSVDMNAEGHALDGINQAKDSDACAVPPPSPSRHLYGVSGATTNLSANQMILQQFMSDFRSRLWFTYRKDMARIEPSFYNSDAGWGCMMRTGQSLLAQAFLQVMLGRDWRIHLPSTDDIVQKYHTLLGWFADEPERYYSIHNIAKSGLALDKRVGEWFGPSTVAHSLRRLSQRHTDCPVSIMVPMESTLRTSEFIQAATDGLCEGHQDVTENAMWKPVVLLMPARFGLNRLTERYTNNLKRLFKLPQFLGIAGGRPGRSLYFVACQDNELFYFDPHVVKSRATQEELSSYPSTSYHCGVVRTMDIMEMDPSMMLGFLVQSLNDLIDLSARLKNDMERGYPLLSILEDVPLGLCAVTSKTDENPQQSPATATAKTLGNESAIPGTMQAQERLLVARDTTVKQLYESEHDVQKIEVSDELQEPCSIQIDVNVEVGEASRCYHASETTRVQETHVACQDLGSDIREMALDRQEEHGSTQVVEATNLQKVAGASESTSSFRHESLSQDRSTDVMVEQAKAFAPQSKREMKRITKGLKKEMRKTRGKRSKSSEPPMLDRTVNSRDAFSVHSLDSDLSL